MGKPGSLHHARFLSCAIYTLKIALLGDDPADFPDGFITDNQLRGIKQMAEFIAVFYGHWFLQARIPAIAPRVNLKLWDDMCMYFELPGCDVLAEAVKISILRHLWYLTEQFVVFSLFDTDTDNNLKARIATKLNGIQRPANFTMGKPKFPEATIAAAEHGEVSLDDLVGPKSWVLFHLLGEDGAWLALPPDQWAGHPGYARMETIVHQFAVCNDSAERGIKDIQEFANLSKHGGIRAQLVMVANDHRARIPAFKKNVMEEEL